MKHYFYVIFFFHFSLLNFSQENSITKNKLLDNFKFKKNLDINNWITCNNDSLFYKSDTIYFHKNLNIYRCKKFIIFSFKNKNSFHLIKGTDYNSYSGIELLSNENLYKIKVNEIKNEIYLDVFKDKVKIETYLVYNLEYDIKEKWKKLVLIRQKKIEN